MRTFAARPSAESQARPLARSSSTPDTLVRLQRAAGNQAVQRSLTGSPLPRELRPSLERAFRRPLENVRVHTGAESQAAADAIGARAFTVGHDIHLGSEGLRTSGKERRELLTHEVVHTLQQGSRTRGSLKVGDSDDAHERQADRLSSALPLHVPETIGHAPGDVAQRSKVSTHYGEFEDFVYGDLKNASGKEVGVEIYLKFHPGAEVQADLIGLTQAGRQDYAGAPYDRGIFGLHQVTQGPGTGHFIDQFEHHPNPLYPTKKDPVAGGDAASLTAYPTDPIVELTAPQQATVQTSTGISGRHYNNWGKHGSRKMAGGTWKSEPAELYDAPTMSRVAPDSQQVFETAALAIAGVQEGRYYGSVQWGWSRDSTGRFKRLPLRTISEGTPSANFLSAAKVWNDSKASFTYVAITDTSLVDSGFQHVIDVPKDSELSPTGRNVLVGAAPYTEVTFGGKTGYVSATNIRVAGAGAETVNLPVPVVHLVSNPSGTAFVQYERARGNRPPTGPNTLRLPFGTRVTVFSCISEGSVADMYYQGEVVQGEHTGMYGAFRVEDLTREELGKRP